MTNIGLLFLDDLRAFAPWISDRGHEFLYTVGAEDNWAPLTVDPPPGLIICVRAESLFDPWPEMPWLRRAKRVALLVETAEVDEEIRLWSHDEVQARRKELGNIVHVVHTAEISTSIIAEASDFVANDAEWRTWDQRPIPEPAPPGPWLQRELPRWSNAFPPDWEYFIRLVVGGLCLPNGYPVLVDALAGKQIDLVSGVTDDLTEVPTGTHGGRTPAMLPDARSWLQSDHHSGVFGVGDGVYMEQGDPRDALADMATRLPLNRPGGWHGPEGAASSAGTSCWMKGQSSGLRVVTLGPMATQRSSMATRTMTRSGSIWRPMQACAFQSTNTTYSWPQLHRFVGGRIAPSRLRKEPAGARERCCLCGPMARTRILLTRQKAMKMHAIAAR